MSYWDTTNNQANGSPTPGVKTPVTSNTPTVTPPAPQGGFWNGIAKSAETKPLASAPYWQATLPPITKAKDPLPTDYESLTKLYDSKKSDFESSLGDFNAKRTAYENEMNKYDGKEIPDDEYSKISNMATDLTRHKAELLDSEDEINSLIDPINLANKQKQIDEYGAKGGSVIGAPKGNTSPVQKDTRNWQQKLYDIPVLGKIFKVSDDSTDDAAYRILNFNKTSAAPSSTPLKRAGDLTTTLLGAGGDVAFAVPSAALKAAEDIPVVGPVAKVVNKLFGNVGEFTGDGFKQLVGQAMKPIEKHITPDERESVLQAAHDIGALGGQILLAKGAHMVGSDALELQKATQARDVIVDTLKKGYAKETGRVSANDRTIESPTPPPPPGGSTPSADSAVPASLKPGPQTIDISKIKQAQYYPTLDKTLPLTDAEIGTVVKDNPELAQAMKDGTAPPIPVKIDSDGNLVPNGDGATRYLIARALGLKDVNVDVQESAPAFKKAIPELKAKNFNEFHPEDQQFLSDLSDKFKPGLNKAPIPEADWKIAEDTWKSYGLTVPKTHTQFVDMIDQAQESGFNKNIDSSAAETPAQPRDPQGRFAASDASRRASVDAELMNSESPLFKKADNTVTTKTLDKLEGKDSVSKQYISYLTNSADLKQSERDIIREVLSEYPEGKDIPVEEFSNKVKSELLPLERVSKGTRYESVSLPADVRGDISDYSEHVYESPVKTSAGDVHYGFGNQGGSPEGYFGHTRIEDLADNSTRRVIEVQSDLYQKGARELDPTFAKENIKTAENNIEFLTKQAKEKGSLTMNDRIIAEQKADIAKYKKDLKDKQTLAQYNNPTAHFRMVREEVRQAAIDGKKTLLFPTGETAMKIEGLGQADRGFQNFEDGRMTTLTKPNDLAVGKEVVDRSGSKWIVTDVLDDGKFKAVPESYSIYHAKEKLGEKELEARKETFDISGKVDTNNPIYRFYEKELGRYLKNQYEAKPFTDDKGVKWYKVEVKPEYGKKPVAAFNKSKGTEKLVPNTEGLKRIEEYKKRLKLKFDTKLLDAILTAEGDSAYGVTYDNTIGLAKDHTKYTPDHEVTHLLIRNLDNIPLFKGLKADEIFAEAREIWGKDLSKTELDEKIAEGYEKYKAERDAKQPTTFTGKVREFFRRLYNGIRDIFDAGPKNVSKLAEFYRRQAEGKSKAPVELKSKGTFPTESSTKGAFKVSKLDEARAALQKTEQKFTDNEKKTIEAFNKSSEHEKVGTIKGKEAVIGTYGKNAIERKIAGGKADRLAISDLKETLPKVTEEYKAGSSGFRKDNTVYIARMADGERRAIVTRINPKGETEIINFFKIGRNYYNFINNLKSFGIPTGTRTQMTPLEEGQSIPLTYGDKSTLATPEKKVNAQPPTPKTPLTTDDYTILTSNKEDRLLIEKGIKELNKVTGREAFQEGLKIKLPESLQEKADALQIEKQALDESPLKDAVRQIAKRGEFKGRVPELTGKPGKGLFAQFGDRYLSEVTGIDDANLAREKIEKYAADKKKFEQSMADFQKEKQSFLKDARAKRDLKIENQKIGRMHDKVDREQAQIDAEAKKRDARIEKTKAAETKRQEELKELQAKEAKYSKQVEQAHLSEAEKKGWRAKLKAVLAPIEATDPTTKRIYVDWQTEKLKAKETGNAAYQEFKDHKENDFEDIVDYEAGKKTPWIYMKFEDLYTEAKRAGLDISHKDNYIPHVYNEKADYIKKAVTKYMEDQKVSKEDIADFEKTGAVPEKMKLNLKIHPFFEKIRTFPDYATAMKYGLSPRFSSVAEHIAYYTEELGKIVANKHLIENLIKEGKVLDAFDAPESWVELKLPGKLRRTYYAEKNLADALNGQFRDENNLSFAQTAFKVVSNAAKVMQEITLSAGLPGSNVNFFSIGQAIKMLTTGIGEAAKLDFKGAATSVKAAAAFIRANFNGRSIKWMRSNQKYIDLMAEHNLSVGTRVGDYSHNYKMWRNLIGKSGRDAVKNSFKTWGVDIKDAKGLREFGGAFKSIFDSRAIGFGKDIFDKSFNEKTFSSMMPQMQIQVFKDIYEGAIKKGVAEPAAAAHAANIVKKEFGALNDLGRTQSVKDVFGSVFFAPKFRESIVNVFVNAAKSYTTELFNPEYARSRSLVIGMAVSFIAYNYLNQQLNNGDNLWDNESGHEFDLKIPLPGGRILYTPFMPSVLSFVRNMGSSALAFARGDNSSGLQKASTLFSMPVQTASELVANKDYFGRPIYELADTPVDKAKKAMAYLGLSVSHPYFSQLVNYFNGKQDIYQTISMMTELPLKFSTDDKAAISRAYDDKKAKTELNASERKDIGGIVTTYDSVQKLKAAGDMEAAKATIDKLSDDEYKQYQAVMKYEQIAALRKARDTVGAKSVLDSLTDDEYLQYQAIKQIRTSAKAKETIIKKADAKKIPKYQPGDKVDTTSILEAVKTYANAIGTDPVTAFNRIFTGQRIRRVDNGAIIVERMSLFDSSKIKSDQGGNNPTMKLDHTIPLELGGDNSDSNLKLVPTDAWESYTPVENKLGKLLRAGKISKKEAQQLITSFKSGQVSGDDILKL